MEAAKHYCPACGRDVRLKGDVYWRHQPDTYVSYRGHRSDPCINSDEPITRPYMISERGNVLRMSERIDLRVVVGIPVEGEAPDFDQTVFTFAEARRLLDEQIKQNFAEAGCLDCREQAKAARRALSHHPARSGDFAAEIDGEMYEIRRVKTEGNPE